jgi:hypothetical protein
MILGFEREQSARNPHRVLAFLAICPSPWLALLGARKFVFVKNHRNIVALFWTNEIKRYKE